MKSFDTIDYYGKHWGLPIFAFDKLDGSNLRFEWSPKRGFYKFGTRNNMIDRTQEQFGFAIDLFLNKYADGLEKVFKSEKVYRNSQSFVCFAELVGTKSEFGWHDYGNDVFDTVLIDVNQYKKGLIAPKQFINDFGHLGIPEVVYLGNLNRELVAAIKANEYNLKEGVICKGLIQTKKGNDQLYYCKIKTNDWMDRLRGNNQEAYEKEMQQASLTING